jgi:hypothetical protein
LSEKPRALLLPSRRLQEFAASPSLPEEMFVNENDAAATECFQSVHRSFTTPAEALCNCFRH